MLLDVEKNEGRATVDRKTEPGNKRRQMSGTVKRFPLAAFSSAHTSAAIQQDSQAEFVFKLKNLRKAFCFAF